MKLYRAITLTVMIVFGLLLVAAMTAYGIGTLTRDSLAALAVVIVAAAIVGIAFSYQRYFPRRR